MSDNITTIKLKLQKYNKEIAPNIYMVDFTPFLVQYVKLGRILEAKMLTLSSFKIDYTIVVPVLY